MPPMLERPCVAVSKEKLFLKLGLHRSLLIHVITARIRSSEVRLHRSSENSILWIPACAALSLALIATALWFWGATEVRGETGPVTGLTFVGGFWLVLAYALFPWLGLSLRDDAVDRRNPAALVALGCALPSVAITFAAGNLGEGPS